MSQPLTYPQIAAAVYQCCTTYDQYLPALSEDVARSWAKVFATHRVGVKDLLDGVDRVYVDKGGGYRPLPADIAYAARAIRRDRAERESQAELEARQAELDAIKPAPEIVERIVGEFVSGPVKHKTPRLIAAENALQCTVDKATAQAAIREFFAAKREASGTR